MNYERRLIQESIKIYERRRYFVSKENVKQRAINISIKDLFPKYKDTHDHGEYRKVNAVIEQFVRDGVLAAKPNQRGYYETVRFRVEAASKCYQFLQCKPIPDICQGLVAVIEAYDSPEQELLHAFCLNQKQLLEEYNKLPYGIDYEAEKLEGILKALKAVERLHKETYIRNFSTAVYHDSKKFDVFRSSIQTILYDYSEQIVEKDLILERFHLVDNPTYAMFKGDARLMGAGFSIDLGKLPGGIALPSMALSEVTEIQLNDTKVITVENLTTYHDTETTDGLVVYLGGFHNEVRRKFLQAVYRQNPQAEYFHKGDIDVYGFLILENLKERTGIPFQPLDMDVETLRKYYGMGYCKELTVNDRKMLNSEKLIEYRDVLVFMNEHNCKVEQESMKAAEIAVC
jgi:hypothetical protein